MLTLLQGDGFWTEPYMDNWARRAKRAPCDVCRRSTRGIYVIDGEVAHPMCHLCAPTWAKTAILTVVAGAA